MSMGGKRQSSKQTLHNQNDDAKEAEARQSSALMQKLKLRQIRIGMPSCVQVRDGLWLGSLLLGEQYICDQYLDWFQINPQLLFKIRVFSHPLLPAQDAARHLKGTLPLLMKAIMIPAQRPQLYPLPAQLQSQPLILDVLLHFCDLLYRALQQG